MRSLFLLLVCLPLCSAAQKSYWQVEHVKPVMARSLFFEAFLESFSTMDYLAYDPATGDMLYYDAYKKEMTPAAFNSTHLSYGNNAQQEWKVTAKIIDRKLKILVYNDNANIGFIICKPAADDEPSFLEKVKASKMSIHNSLMSAIAEHPNVDLPRDMQPGYVQVILDGYSISLPPDTYFISRTETGAYRFFLKSSEEMETNFTLTAGSYSINDSVEQDGFQPISRDGNLWLNARPYFYWETKEKGIGAYMLSYSTPIAKGYMNMQSKEREEASGLFPLVPIFRSLHPGEKGMRPEAYNYPRNEVKSFSHTIGSFVFTLPENYNIREFYTGGSNFYGFTVQDSLSFSSDDSNSYYFPVEELDNQGNTSLNLASGGLYALERSRFRTDIKQIRLAFEQEGIPVLDQDTNGILYHYHGAFFLLRYIYLGNTHYVYSMRFEDMNSCLKEFSRSGSMFP